MADVTIRTMDLDNFRDPNPNGGRIDRRVTPLKRRVGVFPKYVTNSTSPTIDTEIIADNQLPSTYTAGTGLKLKCWLRGVSGNISGVAVMEFSYETLTGSTDDSNVEAWGTPVTGSVTVPTTIGQVVAFTLALVKANCGNGTPIAQEPGRIRLRRLGTNTSDTSTGAIEIIGCIDLTDY